MKLRAYSVRFTNLSILENLVKSLLVDLSSRTPEMDSDSMTLVSVTSSRLMPDGMELTEASHGPFG